MSIIPFTKTNKIFEVLCIDDYMDVVANGQNLIMGVLKVLHMNRKYPKYHNIRCVNNSYKIYTEQGWRKRSDEFVYAQLEAETIVCMEYIQKHGHTMLSILEGLKAVENLEENKDYMDRVLRECGVADHLVYTGYTEKK